MILDAAVTGLENTVKVCAFNINILNTYMHVSCSNSISFTWFCYPRIAVIFFLSRIYQHVEYITFNQMKMNYKTWNKSVRQQSLSVLVLSVSFFQIFIGSYIYSDSNTIIEIFKTQNLRKEQSDLWKTISDHDDTLTVYAEWIFTKHPQPIKQGGVM